MTNNQITIDQTKLQNHNDQISIEYKIELEAKPSFSAIYCTQ